jgi:hypothetical protein
MDTVSNLLALDPSISSTGAAVFLDGRLTHVARIEVPAPKGKRMPSTARGTGGRCLAMAHAISTWVRMMTVSGDFRLWPLWKTFDIAAEWPKIYRGGDSKKPGDQQVPLAAITTAVSALLGGHGRLFTYFPGEWAGRIPKKRTGDGRASVRGRRIHAQLEGLELEVWGRKEARSHDIVDAIGIGLHALGRGYYRRRR